MDAFKKNPAAHRRQTRLLTALIVGMGGASVATGLISSALMAETKPSTASKPDKLPPRCFDPGQVQYFQAVDDQHLMITDNWGAHYLLEMNGFCVGIDTSPAIRIVPRRGSLGQVCSAFDADIEYQSPIRSNGCTITDVTPMRKSQAEAWLKSRGAQPLTEDRSRH